MQVITMKLFISYRRKTWPFTQRLAEDLGELIDGEVFVDYSGIDETDFESSILRNLRESDAVLVVVSEDTFSSVRIHREDDWVRREIAYAIQLNKPIILVRIDATSLPTQLD